MELAAGHPTNCSYEYDQVEGGSQADARLAEGSVSPKKALQKSKIRQPRCPEGDTLGGSSNHDCMYMNVCLAEQLTAHAGMPSPPNSEYTSACRGAAWSDAFAW